MFKAKFQQPELCSSNAVQAFAGHLVNTLRVRFYAASHNIRAKRFLALLLYVLVGGSNLYTFGAQVKATELSVPKDFQRRTEYREVMDRYAQAFHSVEISKPVVLPNQQPGIVTNRARIRRVKPILTNAVQNNRTSQGESFEVSRAFRAPILDHVGDPVFGKVENATLSAGEAVAADFVRTGLAYEGLMGTLVKIVEVLGSEAVLGDPIKGQKLLVKLGYPADLLDQFEKQSDGTRGLQAIATIVPKDVRTMRQAVLKKRLDRELKFSYQSTYDRKQYGFKLADESGVQAIRTMRMQIGMDGYANGVVAGGTIDVVGQVAKISPGVHLVVNMPAPIMDVMEFQAMTSWGLTRESKVTFIGEANDTLAWARDNCLVGTVRRQSNAVEGGDVAALLAPRFACIGEMAISYVPSESLAMDGLRSAGFEVKQSPLIFQGGNFLMVTDPAKNQRVMLLSETEVYRNMGLGLTREQVLEAFTAELMVDRCVVVPSGSYHLDYDISLRTHQGKILAFVNDPMAATKQIVTCGVRALIDAKLLTPHQGNGDSKEKSGVLAGVDWKQLGRVLASHRIASGKYSAEFANLFRQTPTDDGGLNLQLFLSAMDYVASKTLASDASVTDELSVRYFTALRELENTLYNQTSVLEELGWKLVYLPSMPDLFRSINYVNALQDKDRVLMPAVGGFYGELDKAAAAVYERELPGVKVVPIKASAIQRQNGGIHCAVSAMP